MLHEWAESTGGIDLIGMEHKALERSRTFAVHFMEKIENEDGVKIGAGKKEEFLQAVGRYVQQRIYQDAALHPASGVDIGGYKQNTCRLGNGVESRVMNFASLRDFKPQTLQEASVSGLRLPSITNPLEKAEEFMERIDSIIRRTITIGRGRATQAQR